MATPYSQLEIGDSFTMTRCIDADEVQRFSALTNQHVQNPQVVDGMLLLGIISKMLGHDFPGFGTVAVSMSTNFLMDPPIGSTITFSITVTEKIEKRQQIRGQVTAYTADAKLLKGEALLIPPED